MIRIIRASYECDQKGMDLIGMTETCKEHSGQSIGQSHRSSEGNG